MNLGHKSVSEEIFGRRIEIETGRLAKQASGSVMLRFGDTVVLATVVAAKEPSEDDFLPLTVNYQEKSYAAGRIPGGYFKREGRPSEKEILTSRLIDRPIRPLFPRNYTFPTQVIVTVMSTDKENDPDVLSITASSAALMVSDIPFEGPVAGVRVGRINGEFVCNPLRSDMEKSDIDLVVAGTREAIVMVESGSDEVTESDMIDALMFGHESLNKFIDLQSGLVSQLDIKKFEVPAVEDSTDIYNEIESHSKQKLLEAFSTNSKQERSEKLKNISNDTIKYFLEKYGIKPELKAGMHYGHVMAGEIGVVNTILLYASFA